MASDYVVRLKKAIKTDARYYIFMEFCNGSDLKDVMETRQWAISPSAIQKIMVQLVNGFNDMMNVLVIHRDLKLQNVMLHFPHESEKLLYMNKEQRKKFYRSVDFDRIDFEIKIADFGFSKKLKSKS